jgi:phosphoribosylanthranilate isomerase
MFIKVCGITTEEQVNWAVELGYSAIGIMCHEKSPRFIQQPRARELITYARDKIETVAVGVACREVLPLAEEASFIQVYEACEAPHVIAAGTTPPEDREWEYFLYDSSHGSGLQEELPSFLKDMKDRLIIAGGLTSENVADVIRRFSPFGVDVSSGVEEIKGIKDYKKMKQFIQEVLRGAC